MGILKFLARAPCNRQHFLSKIVNKVSTRIGLVGRVKPYVKSSIGVLELRIIKTFIFVTTFIYLY